MSSVSGVVDGILRGPVFGASQLQREDLLFRTLVSLNEYHADRCKEFRYVVDGMFPNWRTAENMEDLPYLPVGIFKRKVLKSIRDDEIYKIVTSSGTSGQIPSRVFLDRTTAKRQSVALKTIMGAILGESRRPMIIIDSTSILNGQVTRSARAAGVVGLMPLGRKHLFLLDEDTKPQLELIRTFLDDHKDENLLMFGFTFMVWQYLIQQLSNEDLDLSNATLIHSGGWKHLQSLSVDNEEFRRRLSDDFGLTNVVNFYGMAEQVGSVFIEANDLRLHASHLSDVIVRDPETWLPQPTGVPGVIQVLSAIPTSYPGHSVLTEDIGVIETIDDPKTGLGGKGFRVLGRLEKAELRGCSDTFAHGVIGG